MKRIKRAAKLSRCHNYSSEEREAVSEVLEGPILVHGRKVKESHLPLLVQLRPASLTGVVRSTSPCSEITPLSFQRHQTTTRIVPAGRVGAGEVIEDRARLLIFLFGP